MHHLIYLKIISDKGSMNTYLFLLPLLSVFDLTGTNTFDDKHGTKLVVVTGFAQPGIVDNLEYPESEVVDLDLDLNCKSWTEFPFEVYASTGALFDIESAKGTEGTLFGVLMPTSSEKHFSKV